MKHLRETRLFLKVIVPSLLTIPFFLILVLTDVVQVGDNGVSVDSNGNIYVGERTHIRVYDRDGNQLRRFPVGTWRNYSFSLHNDCIIVWGAEDTWMLSLEGERLPSKYFPPFTEFSDRSGKYVVGDRTYTVNRTGLRYKVTVTQNGTTRVVVRQPIRDLFATLYVIVILPTIVILGGILIIRGNRHWKQMQRDRCWCQGDGSLDNL